VTTTLAEFAPKSGKNLFLGGMGNFAPHFLGSIKDNQQSTFHIDS